MATDSPPEEPATTTRRGWVLAVTLLACWLPLVVAAAALAAKGWTPVGEFAQAELRVRDFWAHPPTLGAVGRLRTATEVSSHPGPAAWWAAYPVYAIGGRSAVAFSCAVAAMAGAWLSAALVVLWRRAGDLVTLLAALGAIAIMAGLGPSVFLEPWNPWFALMPFLAMLVSVWAVSVGGRWALVLAAAAGTFCVQAHLGYAPLVGLLGLLALYMLWVRERGSGHVLVRIGAPLLVAAGVAGVMWLPPLLEQLLSDPGNIGIMLSAYRAESGAEGELGLSGALQLVGAYLDPRAPWLLLEDSSPTQRGFSVGSVLLIAAWAAAALVATLRRDLPRMRAAGLMQLVAAVGVLGAWLAASRIPGEVFGYLVLWLLPILLVAVVSVIWTLWIWAVAVLRADRVATGDGTLPAYAGTLRGLGVVALAVASVATAWSFSDPREPGGSLSDTAEDLVGQTEASLGDRLHEGGGFVVRWDDPAAFGALGTAVLSELERDGAEVGVDERLSTEMRGHRVLAPGEADAAIWVVSGDSIESWRALADVEELARADPRSEADRARQAVLESEIRAALAAAGMPELAEQLSDNLWTVRSAPGVGPSVDALIDEYTELGLPTAVFLAPTGTTQPSSG